MKFSLVFSNGIGRKSAKFGRFLGQKLTQMLIEDPRLNSRLVKTHFGQVDQIQHHHQRRRLIISVQKHCNSQLEVKSWYGDNCTYLTYAAATSLAGIVEELVTQQNDPALMFNIWSHLAF